LTATSAVERIAWLALVALAVALLGQGLWIPVKGALAQVLLELAWEEARARGEPVAPWPWADTRLVARLHAPARGVELVVLAGASGAALAFAPGHVEGTAAVGEGGHTVLAGHRDTHFRFLRELQRGEELLLEDLAGRLHAYRVRDLVIVDEHEVGILAESPDRRLTLLTCYPFDSPVPGGPLRYAVTATGQGAGDLADLHASR
jgi:sortase A